jgi:hypothetical protein
MPKFKVEVTVIAECTYTVEVEESNERIAEDQAHGMWGEMLPEDFQVSKGYITDWDTETTQLTWECVECEAEITEQQSHDQDEMCAACFKKAEAEG